MLDQTKISMHSVLSVTVKQRWLVDGTEWATISIPQANGTETELTVFDRKAIDDVMHLPKADDYRTNITAEMDAKIDRRSFAEQTQDEEAA